ncbi:hypothetical protein [Sediminibacterium sp.]|uniref:hypothetical protein n=1 Tax=Sediminibacterium sp. TaxID=1917865 RepID=UPI0025DF6963|nr:hypothetical protein [Sediminibacterium sp.]
MSTPPKQHYTIPLKYRKMENMHIVFWLFKDVAWCLGLKVLGITMIVPTLTIALIISWRTRNMMSELCHNIAIAVWISANSYWMISEFLGFADRIVWEGFTFKQLALIPFGMGVLILAFYYIIWRPKHKEENETM